MYVCEWVSLTAAATAVLVPSRSSFNSRLASRLSRRSCLSISALIRFDSLASSLRQQAIIDSKVIPTALLYTARPRRGFRNQKKKTQKYHLARVAVGKKARKNEIIPPILLLWGKILRKKKEKMRGSWGDDLKGVWEWGRGPGGLARCVQSSRGEREPLPRVRTAAKSRR